MKPFSMTTRSLPSLHRGTVAALLSIVFALGGCRTRPGSNEGQPQDPVTDTKPTENGLPPLELRDDTKDLLLTWVDPEGEFRVVEKPAEVPEAGKAQVRVVVTTQVEGTGDVVYVADLREKDATGRYKVTTLTRAQWNALGADRRKVRLETLLQKKQEREAAPATSGPIADGKAHATIYGADWCKPCHDAEDYLKTLGVKVTMKNIEKSNAARAEMQQKLERAGKAGASIPVIDVMGQLFVGFNRGALRRAVERSLKPKAP